MIDLDAWVHELATRAVPGAAAAGAVAAAMGAALLAKAVAVTLRHLAVQTADPSLLQAVPGEAEVLRADFLRWARADEQAYRAVLDTRSLAADAPARQRAWQAATEVPLQIAEECQSLLTRISTFRALCWPAVQPELQTGISLLEAGREAGILAAEANLRSFGDSPAARRLQARVHALQQVPRA